MEMKEIDNNTVKFLQDNLQQWGMNNLREYPWRFDDDPYRILVSEFMLHRTRTSQVIPVYTTFIQKFPTLGDLTGAERGDVMAVLKPLGLIWRNEGMVNALNSLWIDYGQVPADYEKLISIRGIGQYIAGATVVFALNEPRTLVDTNIVRVVGRVFDLDFSGEPRRKKGTIRTISAVMNRHDPRRFYYSMIDLAHMICLIGKPMCQNCPLLIVPCSFGSAMMNRAAS